MTDTDMLVLTRKVGETIMIGDEIEIIVTRFERNAVRLAIQAPPHVRIYRGELYRQIGNSSLPESNLPPPAPKPRS